MLKQLLPGTIPKGFHRHLSGHGSLHRLNMQREADSQMRAQGTFGVSGSAPPLPLAKPPTLAATSLPVQGRLGAGCAFRMNVSKERALAKQYPFHSPCSCPHRKSCSTKPNSVVPANL